MTSEQRYVRPYLGLEAFQAVLDRWRIRLAGEVVEPGHRLTVSSNAFRHDPTVLVCAADDDELESIQGALAAAAEAIQVDLSEIELVVLARTPYLKLADIVHQEKLSYPSAIPKELVMTGDELFLRALCTPSGGCDIEVTLCLANDLSSRRLRPRRHGTWLARAQFTIRTELGELGFTPRPLTSEERSRLGLGPDTIRFVEIDPDALLLDEIDDAVQLFVDDQLLATLNSSPNTPAARMFQRQLFLDVMSAVVRAVPRLPDYPTLELTTLEETILGRILDSASPPGRGESATQKLTRRETSLGLLKNQPELFLAHIENTASARDDVLTALAGAEE